MYQVAVVFIAAAVVITVAIVLAFDLLWDGRFNVEMEIAGVVTPFLVAPLLVGLFTVLLNELREEVERRKAAESSTRMLNEELEAKVAERTRQLLAAQDELVRKEKLTLLAQVADSVGHELRNPLGVMSNAVYFLKSVLSDAGENTKEYLGIVECEIAETERIVADLLDAVRTKPPQFETVDVAELIGQTLRKCAVPPAVTISLDLAETLSPLNVDPKQIQQVLCNLMTNGLEAMPEGGTLEIRATEDRQGRTLRISIKDSGVGIAPEHQDKLFQPLFTTKTRRVGLGLAAVKNLIQVNRGSVDMKSEPGKGSTFSVTLPTGGSDAETI
jgi:signal transduction histidine kinase